MASYVPGKVGYNHLAVFACVTSGVHIVGGRPGQIAGKVCQISHLGLGRWDGGENLETGTCGEITGTGKCTELKKWVPVEDRVGALVS